ncbi:beta-lactamase hydrolase domain-containing protein [Hyphobacterium sp.]|uniref:beta-lactamase hydrolase domain-containing protein n=1 Tax=Hyphobacterium sp. TaxID=2004662 RepID=UPI003BA9BBC2
MLLRVLLPAILISTAAAIAQETPDSIVSEHGSVWFAGQPTEADLQAWSEAGVTTIINLRPDSEMEGVDFDEPAAIDALGISYTNIPMPREAYTPETVDLIGQTLETAQGRVVVHCTIGWRASHSYTAYLIESGHMTPQEAVDLNLWPRDGINEEMMRRLSPAYAAAFPE